MLALAAQAVGRYTSMDDAHIAIAYANEDHLAQAAKIVLFIVAEGTAAGTPLH